MTWQQFCDAMEREVFDNLSRGEWLDLRLRDVTASSIGALFNIHPFVSPEQLVAEKRGLGGVMPTSSMRAGNILEGGFPAAVKLDEKPWDLIKATTYERLPQHRLGATPDFWIPPDGLLQAKTASREQFENWHGVAPLAYSLQTLTELLVTGRRWGVLAVMIRGGSYPIHYFNVPRHEAAERRILDAVAAWWKAFDAGTHPLPASSDNLAEVFEDGSHVDLSADNYLCAVLPEREKLKAEVSGAEKRLKEIDEALKAALGTASTAWVPGYNISFKSQHRRETVIPARDIRVLRVRANAEKEGADAEQ
jgi:predicted phage-related endonuclease